MAKDPTDLVRLIKKIALEAVDASNPTAIVYGKVSSVSPLKVYVEQKITLSKEQLVLTRSVKDHTVQIIDNGTTKTITIKNGLVAGDKVVMLRMQGGQQYIVIDKIGG